MPEYTYINHKVKKGETLYGISRQYTVEEHKILQANPEIKITPKGKGKYEIANLKEGQILRIPQKKKIGKRGVKAITGNTTPKAGIKEKYRVTEWYPGTPTEMKNPANVKWAVYYKEKGKYILKFKKEIGEFTFHEQAIGKDIKIVGYLYSPELGNDSALSVKVSPNQKPSLTSLTLYDVKKDKPLSQNAKLKLGQILYVVANTTGSVGKKIEFTLLKKEEKQGKTEYKTVTNTTEKVSTKGTATTAFPLNDYKLLVNPIKKHEYKVKAQLEEGNAKKDKPKQQPKKEESIIYKGTIFFKEGWNKFRETYKEMTTSEEPQIQKVSLYIPGNKRKVSYGEKLKLKIEGKNLKGQSIEYTVYEDDWPLKDELDSSIVQMKADVQELDIQLTKEMYKKGGTSWLELADGKHEIYVDVKLKGDILAKSTKIIEVDTSTIKMEPIPGNRAVMTGEDKKIENCLCKQYDLIWGAKVSCEFRKKVVEISKRQNFDPNHLMAVMKVETSGTFSPSKIELRPNGKYRKDGSPKKEYRGLTKNEILKLDENFAGAVGLIQFTPAAINGLNSYYKLTLTKRKLALMTDLEQLDYVEKYIVMWKDVNKIKNKLTLADLYLLVFAPSKMNGSDDSTTLYKEGTSYYEANKSIDTDGKNGITKKELAKRAYDSYIEGKGYKAKEFSCGLVPKKETDKNEKGVLDEMKELVDKHIPYSQEGVRNSMSKEGLKALDCSETVAIYLYKLGITSEVKAIYTGLMTTQSDFRKAINSDKIDFVSGSNKSDFKPERGDIFVWRKSNGVGHTGIVYEYDESTDLVTILEAIGRTGAVGESQQVKNGGYSGKGCSRTAIYMRNSGALSTHDGWKGYFRPKNYTKKL